MEEPKQYVIETMQDIADVITVDNKERFVKDFSGVLNMLLLAKVAAVGDPSYTVQFNNFTWIDDNKHTITMNLIEDDSQPENRL